MRRKTIQRRPAQPFGQRDIATQPIAAERQLETVCLFVTLLRRFNIVEKDRKLGKNDGWSEYLRVQNDLVVSRIRERLAREGKLQKRGGLFSAVYETEQALCQMSEDQLLRLRARMILNDFRLSEKDKEQGA